MTNDDPILLLETEEKQPETVEEVLQKSCIYPVRSDGDNSRYEALRVMENEHRLAKAERAAEYSKATAALQAAYVADVDQMDIDLARKKHEAGFSVTDYIPNC